MGAAARQRGDALIRQHSDEALRDKSRGVWPILDRLEHVEPGPVKPMVPSGVVRPDPVVTGRFWLMHRKEDGWGSYSRLRAALRGLPPGRAWPLLGLGGVR